MLSFSSPPHLHSLETSMTFRRPIFSHFVARVLILCIAGLGAPLPAQAALIASDAAISTKRAQILQVLDRSDVQQALQARGVSADQVKARVVALSDDEAAQVAAQLDSLPAGGDFSILGAIIFVFLVLLLTDILGFTKSFPFTRPIR